MNNKFVTSKQFQVVFCEAEAAAAVYRGEGGGGRRHQDLHQPAQPQDHRQHGRLLHGPVCGGGQEVGALTS